MPRQERGAIEDFLRTSGLPQLSDEVLQALEFPIMTEEVLGPSNPCPRKKPQAQMALQLPTSKKFVELLVPHFIKAYNCIAEGHRVGDDTLRAHITLIPKDGKDLTECQSYRPIIGFINMREARDSITRVLDLIHARQGCPLSPLHLALTIEPFLRTVRADPSIHRIQIPGLPEQKVAAYTDDLLFLYLSHIFPFHDFWGLLENLELSHILKSISSNLKH